VEKKCKKKRTQKASATNCDSCEEERRRLLRMLSLKKKRFKTSDEPQRVGKGRKSKQKWGGDGEKVSERRETTAPKTREGLGVKSNEDKGKNQERKRRIKRGTDTAKMQSTETL